VRICSIAEMNYMRIYIFSSLPNEFSLCMIYSLVISANYDIIRIIRRLIILIMILILIMNYTYNDIHDCTIVIFIMFYTRYDFVFQDFYVDINIFKSM